MSKLRHISKMENYKRYSYDRKTKAGETLFNFSIKVANQLKQGHINTDLLTNFLKAMDRVIRSDKDFDGVLFYHREDCPTVEDLGLYVEYCSDRWCAGRAASIVKIIKTTLLTGETQE